MLLVTALTLLGYTLARSMYEDSLDQPLDKKLLESTVYSTAMIAYDNASNPNRTRGGLKKCDEMSELPLSFEYTETNSPAELRRFQKPSENLRLLPRRSRHFSKRLIF